MSRTKKMELAAKRMPSDERIRVHYLMLKVLSGHPRQRVNPEAIFGGALSPPPLEDAAKRTASRVEALCSFFDRFAHGDLHGAG